MNIFFAFLLTLISTVSLAAEIPTGYSEWLQDECPDESSGCVHVVSIARVLRDETHICGEISVSYSLRQPSAWFAGKLADDTAHVRFFDSFQSDGAPPGTALIQTSVQGLTWRVLQFPNNGMIPGEIQRLRHVPAKDEKFSRPQDCNDLVEGYSELAE